jgi:uncharacterized protein YndB with AHSA1/START domain
MPRFERRIVIDAPIEQVWEFIAEPRNLEQIWPNVIAVRDVTPTHDGGNDFTMIFDLDGVKYEVDTHTAEYDPPRRLVAESRSEIVVTVGFTLAPEGNGTRFTFEVEAPYDSSLLGKMASSSTIRRNPDVVRILLDNLKRQLESPSNASTAP